ncbi:MAG: hypothetical protein ACLGJA_26175, partial [Gammaproteobacteria bacterium]
MTACINLLLDYPLLAAALQREPFAHPARRLVSPGPPGVRGCAPCGLEQRGELKRIQVPISPVLEMT